MKYDDPSEHFWKEGKIKYFENNSLYTDIFNIDDIYKYYGAADVIAEVKKLKEQEKKQENGGTI
jgi:hypothetical protein